MSSSWDNELLNFAYYNLHTQAIIENSEKRIFPAIMRYTRSAPYAQARVPSTRLSPGNNSGKSRQGKATVMQRINARKRERVGELAAPLVAEWGRALQERDHAVGTVK